VCFAFVVLCLGLKIMVRKFEYKNIRFDFKGRGISQEINLLDIDGNRVKGWYINTQDVPTLPQLLNAAGTDGWELVSHSVNQDNQNNGVTFHYLYFKREVV
jgi:hypothetical protein